MICVYKNLPPIFLNEPNHLTSVLPLVWSTKTKTDRTSILNQRHLSLLFVVTGRYSLYWTSASFCGFFFIRMKMTQTADLMLIYISYYIIIYVNCCIILAMLLLIDFF